MWMTSRCQDQQTILKKGGSLLPHKMIWTSLRTQDDTLVVNMCSTMTSNWRRVIIPLPMSLMQVSPIHLVRQPVRPAERGATGSTCRSWEYMFIIICNLARSSRTSRRTTCLSGREAEARGELQPIASCVLMKVLFAARIARFDLLRATQGLASRVTKWSPDCDKSLHRLMRYIYSTIDRTLIGFVGDPPEQCKAWLFADSNHAGEHDNRSTSGCLLALVGPDTFFHVLSTHSFFKETDFNSYVFDRG